MHVKTYTGTSPQEIMARIKDEMGPEAIILSNQKKVKDKKTHYEIMAALDMPSKEKPPTLDGFMPQGQDDASCLREDWTKLRRQLMMLIKPQLDMSQLTARQQKVFEYLEREGVKEDMLLDLWEKFRRSPSTPALSVMNDLIRLSPWLGTRWAHKVHLLAGPFGSGKTTTTLRLALALKKRQPTMRILVANADHSQGKGRLYLRHYAELSGLSYQELESPAQWANLQQEAQFHDLVLVDLPGLPSVQTLDAWLRQLSGNTIPNCHLHLVLSPHFGATQMDNFVSRMRSGAASSIIWTKLDEACSYGEILNQANATRLPISLFSVGPDLKNTLVQPKDNDIWKLLLRHELPIATH